MRKILSFAVISVLLTSACAGEKAIVFENGDQFFMRDDQAGEPVRPGEVIKFHLSAYNGDSLLQSSRFPEDKIQEVIMPEVDATTPENGLVQAFRQMSQGDSATLIQKVDAEAAAKMPPGLDPTKGIRYEIKLVEVLDSAAVAALQAEMQIKAAEYSAAYSVRETGVADSVATAYTEYKSDPAAFTTTASGLKYKILQPGNGTQASPGTPVLVSYYGVLLKDGTMFDNSFANGQPIEFPLGKGGVIPGWDEGIALLSEGARAVLVIPANLAYGERATGPIPPNSDLVFYVHLEEIAK